MRKTKEKNNRWAIIDQTFLSLLMTFAMIELTNRGAGIVDGLFVSNFMDAKAIASVGVVKSIFSLTGIVSGILSVGMQSRCAQELGKGDIKSFRRIFSSMFYISVITSLISMILLMVAARPVAILMGASGNGAELADGAVRYLRGIGIGVPALVLAPFLSSACQLDSAKSMVRKSGIIYFVGNCSFDYLAVKLNMGEFGIGLATSLAMYLHFGHLMLHFTTKDRMLHFVKFDMKLKEIMETLSFGTEKALRSLSKVIAPAIVNRIILIFGGTIAMSAFSIQKDFMDLAEIVTVGIADATALMAGVYYGEMNSETIHAVGKNAHKNIAVFLGVVCAVLVIFAKPIAGFYISEQGELFNMVVFASVMTGIYAPLNGMVRARISYLNAVKRVKYMQIMTFLSSVVYAISGAWILGKIFGAYGVLASELLRVVLLLLTTWLYHAVKSKKLIPSVKDYLFLPESFDLNPGDVISLDIRDMDDVSLVAEQIELFCMGHDINSQVGMKAAICFEELTANTIKYGFPRCKNQPSIDLRMICTEDELILRIKDNCPVMNLEPAPEDNLDYEDELQLSLKMINDLANNVSHIRSLETNNVILRFPLTEQKEEED